jgi:hypothetical protein
MIETEIVSVIDKWFNESSILGLSKVFNTLRISSDKTWIIS